jgi:hypothetical protein
MKQTAGKGQRGTGGSLSGILIWAAMAVLLIPLILVLVLHLPWVQNSLISRVIKRVERDANVKIELGTLQWRPFSHLNIKGLEVQSAGETFLQSEQIDLAYYPVWRWPYVHPTELHLDKPVIQLEKDSQGNWVLAKGNAQREASPDKKSDKKTSGAGTPFWAVIPLPRVIVNSALIEGRQDGQTVLLLRNVTGALSFRVISTPEGPRLAIDLDKWRGEAVMPQWGTCDLTGRASLGANDICMDDVSLSVGEETRVHVEGRWMQGEQQEGSYLKVQLDPLVWSAFPELQSRFRQLERVTGLLHARKERETWMIDHDICSNLGNLKGYIEADAPFSPDGKVRWSSRFQDIKVPHSEKIPPNSFQGQVELTLQGDSVETVQGRITAHLEPSRWGDEVIHKGELIAECKEGMLTLKNVAVQSSLGAFHLSASGDLNGLWNSKHEGEIQALFEADKARIDEIFAESNQQIEGTASIRVHYGPGDLLEWKRWQGELDAHLSSPRLAAVKVDGSFKGESVDAKYDLNVADIQMAESFIPSLHGKGQVKSRGTFKGKWPDIEWRGEIEAQRLQYNAHRVDQARVEGTAKGNRQQLKIKAQGISLSGKNIQSLDADIVQQEDKLQFQVRGDGVLKDASVQMSGTLDNIWGPHRIFMVSKSTIGWNGVKYSLDGKLHLENDRISVDALNISREKQKLRLTGVLSSGSGSNLEAVFSNITVGEWLDALGHRDLLAGSAEGRVLLSGRLEAPKITASLHLVDGAAMKERIERLDLQGAYAASQLQIQGSLHTKAAAAPASLTAKVPLLLSFYPPQCKLRGDESIDAAVRISELNLEGLLHRTPFLTKLAGSVNMDVQVTGSLSQPKVYASGALQDGTLQLKAWPHPMQNIQLAVEADSKQIYIKEGKLDFLNGKVDVGGRTDFKFEQVDLEAVGYDIVFPEIFGIQGKGLAKARLTGGIMRNPRIDGSAQLSSAKMSIPELETDIAQEDIKVVEGKEDSRIMEIKGEGDNKDDFFDRLHMDLDLRLPPSGTWVRGRGLDAEVIGSMRLQKEPVEKLRFIGDFQALRGTYTFQDTRLNIVEGDLVFRGSSRPDLRVLAQKDVGDVTIQAQTSGPLQQPKLVLSSIPSMDQVDILSYLFFGRPAGKLDSRENVALQERAAYWLSSEASDVMKKILGKTPLTPDVVRLRASDDGGSEGGVVEVGKYLTPDIYVTYEKGIEEDVGDQVKMEYRFNRNLSVQSQLGRENQSGVDVFWRFDFDE